MSVSKNKKDLYAALGCLLCLGAVSGCGDPYILHEGGADGQHGSDDGAAGAQGAGSLSTPTIEDQEWEAYLTRAAEELDAQPTVIAPWAELLPAETSISATIGADHVVLPNTVTGQPDYRVGDVLISDHIEADKVFLRRVTGVSVEGAVTRYQTEPAAVTDVVFRGEMTNSATQAVPGHVHVSAPISGLVTLAQALVDLSAFEAFVPTKFRPLSTLFGGPWSWQVGSGKFALRMNLLDELTFDNSNTRIDQLNVKISWEGLGRALGSDTSTNELFVALNHPDHPRQSGVEVRRGGDRILDEKIRQRLHDGYRLRTSCKAVIRALQVIDEVPDCKLFYEGWIHSSLAPQIAPPEEIFYGTGAIPHVGVRTREITIEGDSVRLHKQPLRVLTCEPGGWFSSPQVMPFREQVEWAQRSCEGGALEEFDFAATFAPKLRVGHAQVQLEYAGEGDLLESSSSGPLPAYSKEEIDSVQKQLVTLGEISKTARFFFGWVPVVMTVKGEVTHSPFQLEGAGSIVLGVEELLDAAINLHPEVHYSGGEITSLSSWDTSKSVYEVNIEVASKEDFFIGDASGNLSLKSQPVGLRTELLFYGAAGLFLSGPNFYTRLDVNTNFDTLGDVTLSDEETVCPIGLHSGISLTGGFKGKIPLTDKEADFQFGPGYDSCGAPGNRTNISFYKAQNAPCLKHCFSRVPLQVYAKWDKPVDVDLLVFDSKGAQASYSSNGIEGADHKHQHGCAIEDTCQGPNYEEAVIWSVDPEQGEYRVVLRSHSAEAVHVTGFVRAQQSGALSYALDLPIDVSLPAGGEHEFTFTIAR